MKSNADNYVPNLNEVSATLKALNNEYKSIFQMFLLSGIRKIEGEYILKNLNTLKVQDMGEFVKIQLDLYRNTKNAYFCYLPTSLFDLLKTCEIRSISGIETQLKRKKLIAIKYTRKWFYSKCIEIGIPDSIADYYQGRTSNSVDSKHFLSKQVLADKFYKDIVSKIIK